MFKHEIILKTKQITAQNSMKIVIKHNTLLYYGFNNIQDARQKVIKEYPYKDSKGRYRILENHGGRVDERYQLGYKKNPEGYIIVKGKICKKKYKDGYDTIPMESIWEFSYTKSIYPTQKPYKLLERIICLSTV